MILLRSLIVMQSHASRLIALGLFLSAAPARSEEAPAAPAPATAPDAVPAEAVPAEAVPAEAVPAEAVPAEAVPPTPSAGPVATDAPLPSAPPPVAIPPVIGLPRFPTPSPAIFASLEAGSGVPLAGIERGEVFLRDARDRLRLYPSARLALDLATTPGAPDLPVDPSSGALLGPSFYVRRALFEVSGEIGSRLAFTVGFELGGARIGSFSAAAAPPPRVAMATAHDGRILPADVTVSYRYRRWLNVTVGQQLVPFSASNRTPDDAHSLTERPLAIRAFAAPWHRDLGLTMWGEAAPREYLHYELGVFGGDGYENVFADALPEFAGRITSRPFKGLGGGFLLSNARIGLSARVGARDPDRVAYDYANVTTAQGWVLWQPGYVDGLGRRTRVLPSGLQRAFGGELRLPFQLPGGRVLDLQAEAYHVANDTREAVQGFLTTNTERLGRFSGVGWYAQLSFWCCGGPVREEDLGTVRPRHVVLEPRAELESANHSGLSRADIAARGELRRGIELLAIASGIHARYDAASRGGATPTPVDPSGDVRVFQVGGAAQYWIGRHFRGGVHYMAYYAPDAATPANLVVLPASLPDRDGVTSGSSLSHELTLRLQAGF